MNDVQTPQRQTSTAAPSDRTRQGDATQVQEQNRYSDPALTPPVDVVEDSSGITLYADLPGVSKETLHLEVEAGTLTIEAELNISLPKDLQATHTEVGLGRFRRSFTLSKELDTDKVSANLEHGVLTLRIPKAAHAQPRRIQVQS